MTVSSWHRCELSPLGAPVCAPGSASPGAWGHGLLQPSISPVRQFPTSAQRSGSQGQWACLPNIQPLSLVPSPSQGRHCFPKLWLLREAACPVYLSRSLLPGREIFLLNSLCCGTCFLLGAWMIYKLSPGVASGHGHSKWSLESLWVTSLDLNAWLHFLQMGNRILSPQHALTSWLIISCS